MHSSNTQLTAEQSLTEDLPQLHLSAKPASPETLGRQRSRAKIARALKRFLSQVNPGKSRRLLAIACFINRQKQPFFCRAELEHYMDMLPESEHTTISQRALIHLSKVGLIERHKRGVYTLTDKGHEEINTLIEAEKRRGQTGPSFAGIDVFLKCFAQRDPQTRVLLTAYFLRRFEKLEALDAQVLYSCLRVAGLVMPSKVVKSHVKTLREQGSFESIANSLQFKLSEASFCHLKRRPYVRYAESLLDHLQPNLN